MRMMVLDCLLSTHHKTPLCSARGRKLILSYFDTLWDNATTLSLIKVKHTTKRVVDRLFKMKLCCWSKTATSSSSRNDNDPFQPKPSPLSKKYCRDSLLPNDHDIWVESSYQNSTTGAQIPYYRSLRSGQCRKMEPPTGARRLVRPTGSEGEQGQCARNSRDRMIRAMAQQTLTKDQIRSMPTPRSNPKVVQRVMTAQQIRGRRRGQRHAS